MTMAVHESSDQTENTSIDALCPQPPERQFRSSPIFTRRRQTPPVGYSVVVTSERITAALDVARNYTDSIDDVVDLTSHPILIVCGGGGGGRHPGEVTTLRVQCSHCRQRRACCRCGRHLCGIATSSTGCGFNRPSQQQQQPRLRADVPPDPSTSADCFNAGRWPCWHCVRYDHPSVAWIRNTATAAGGVDRLTAVAAARSKTILRLNVNQNRRAAATTDANSTFQFVHHSIRLRRLETSDYRQSTNAAVKVRSDSAEDDDADDDDSGRWSSTTYAELYRKSQTVDNVGQMVLGDRTLNDIDPSDDPYLRKFRNCGSVYNFDTQTSIAFTRNTIVLLLPILLASRE